MIDCSVKTAEAFMAHLKKHECDREDYEAAVDTLRKAPYFSYKKPLCWVQLMRGFGLIERTKTRQRLTAEGKKLKQQLEVYISWKFEL